MSGKATFRGVPNGEGWTSVFGGVVLGGVMVGGVELACVVALLSQYFFRPSSARKLLHRIGTTFCTSGMSSSEPSGGVEHRADPLGELAGNLWGGAALFTSIHLPRIL